MKSSTSSTIPTTHHNHHETRNPRIDTKDIPTTRTNTLREKISMLSFTFPIEQVPVPESFPGVTILQESRVVEGTQYIRKASLPWISYCHIPQYVQSRKPLIVFHRESTNTTLAGRDGRGSKFPVFLVVDIFPEISEFRVAMPLKFIQLQCRVFFRSVMIEAGVRKHYNATITKSLSIRAIKN